MVVTVKYCLKPNKSQEKRMLFFAHTARWAYNWALSERVQYYREYGDSLSVQDLLGRLQELKYGNPDYSWVRDCPEAITKQAIRDLDRAYKNFFRTTSKFPKYKRRSTSKLSFYQRTDKLKYWDDTSRVTITGVGHVKIKNRYNFFPEHPLNPRVTHDGKYWYISVSYEVEPIKQSGNTGVIGVDLGVLNLAVRSDGVVTSNINKSDTVKRLEKRLKQLKRQLSRKYEKTKERGTPYKKTNNIKKLEHTIRLLYRRISNIRLNHLHNATADIVKTKPCRVVVEDLNIRGMLKNRYLSRAIQAQGFHKFATLLSYKCEFYGIEMIRANMFYPSTKRCSRCGHIKAKMSLSERTYTCQRCGNSLDRDLNSAINLAQLAI